MKGYAGVEREGESILIGAVGYGERTILQGYAGFRREGEGIAIGAVGYGERVTS